MSLKNYSIEELKAEIESRNSNIPVNTEDIFTCTTYEEVCRRLGEVEINDENKKVESFKRIKQIERYFNQGWEPNWSNNNEPKWFPYFDFKNGWWVFFDSRLVFYCSVFQVGFYKNEEISNHVGIYFIDIYTSL